MAVQATDRAPIAVGDRTRARNGFRELTIGLSAAGLGLAAEVALAVTNVMPGGTAGVLAGVGGLAAVGFAVSGARRIFATLRDLDEQHANLHDQSQIDPLTGLLNRKAFMQRMDDIAPGDIKSVSVLFFDLDKFKDINDTLGHRIGDQLLIEVARRTRAIVGDDVHLARLGGDEFSALMFHRPDRSPELVGNAIIEALSKPIQLDEKIVSTSASLGIAIGSDDTQEMQKLLRQADIAMYAAKSNPTSRCRVFDDDLSSRQKLESVIRFELGQPGFVQDLSMLFQPIVDLRTGMVASAEGLLRWKSRSVGDVPPSLLIPIAEESGDIEALTDWTLDVGLSAIRELGFGVAINISPTYFKKPDFVHVILDRLLNANVRPELLTLELTEGVLIENIDRAQRAVNRLRDVGVKFVLDDFGTGYSSLSYLQHFALDGLKLDKSFLRNAGEKRQATQIVRTMVNFGQSLDMKVVVEGVENEWQLRLLQLIGCDFAQGFEIGAPMSLEDIRAMHQRGALFPDCPATGELPPLVERFRNSA